MTGPKVLALILAGGEGGRLELLTDVRAKPAMPFAGVYRLIDFPLSNCVHSGISDVWVLQQYEPHSLSDHLSNGRPWLHHERDAEVTVVTTRVPRGEAGRFGVVSVDGDGRVDRFEYKPDEPSGDVVATEVFVYSAASLLAALEELGEDRDDGSGLTDFGEQLLPYLVGRGRAFAFPLDGFWRDVGTLDSYFDSQLELLGPEPALRLDDPGWPILTVGTQRPPARIEGAARIDGSWISPGCVVQGHVERSVLGPGTVVEEGAQLRNAVLFHDVRVSAGARVERTIVDERAWIGTDARIGDADDELALVGRGARIEERSVVDAGDRVAPTAG